MRWDLCNVTSVSRPKFLPLMLRVFFFSKLEVWRSSSSILNLLFTFLQCVSDVSVDTSNPVRKAVFSSLAH